MFWIKIASAIIAVWLTSVLTNAVFSRWPKTGKWAITSGTLPCPDCGESPRRYRIPNDMEEALWGGNTCAKCGTKFDKHGNKRETKAG